MIVSIIVDINDGRRKLNSKKFMLPNYAVDSAVHGNSIFKFSKSGEDNDINIQFEKFNRSNIKELYMQVGCKVGHDILF